MQKKQKKRNLDYSCDDGYFVRYCYVCYGDKGLKVLDKGLILKN